MELKPLICENCGGTIDRRSMRCPYCNTEYARENNGVQIRHVVVRPGENRLCAQVAVDMDMIACDPEMARTYALDMLRQEIADGLLAYMKITASVDYGQPLRRCQIIRGEVRVIDPVFADN